LTIDEYWEWNDRADDDSFVRRFAAWFNSRSAPLPRCYPRR